MAATVRVPNPRIFASNREGLRRSRDRATAVGRGSRFRAQSVEILMCNHHIFACLTTTAITVAALIAPTQALAHCYLGSRFLPATLTSEDPCVADELSLPTVSWFRHPANGNNPVVRETTIAVDFAKRITPDLGISIGRDYLIQKPDGMPTIRGWDNLKLGLKYQLYPNPAHEFIFSLGLDADLGGTGARRVGADSFSTLTPTMYFGKGFGDLPDSVAMLRPFAVTGAVGYGIPSRSANANPDTGDVGLNPHTLVTGFSLQYSLPYLQQNVRDTGFAAIANHLIPMVEVSLSTPLDRGQNALRA